MRAKVAELVQLVGLVVTGVGIGLEVGRAADVGFLYISIGSIVFAIGCKLKCR